MVKTNEILQIILHRNFAVIYSALNIDKRVLYCCSQNPRPDLRAQADLPDNPNHVLCTSRLEFDPANPRIVSAEEASPSSLAHSGSIKFYWGSIKFYSGSIKFYWGSIKFFSGSIFRFYTASIMFYSASIMFYSGSIMFYSGSIMFCSGSIILYSGYIMFYSGSIMFYSGLLSFQVTGQYLCCIMLYFNPGSEHQLVLICQIYKPMIIA